MPSSLLAVDDKAMRWGRVGRASGVPHLPVLLQGELPEQCSHRLAPSPQSGGASFSAYSIRDLKEMVVPLFDDATVQELQPIFRVLDSTH